MTKNSFYVMTVILVAVSALVGCSRKNAIDEISFEPTPVISTSERFAVIIDPYISLRDQPGSAGITIAHGRRGDICEITGKQYVQGENEPTVWLNLGQGWVHSSSVQLYSSRSRAVTAATLLK